MEPVKRLWVATAPAGVWSSGPSVIYDLPGIDAEEACEGYRRMGWRVDGPYVLQEPTVKVKRIIGRRLVEVEVPRVSHD